MALSRRPRRRLAARLGARGAGCAEAQTIKRLRLPINPHQQPAGVGFSFYFFEHIWVLLHAPSPKELKPESLAGFSCHGSTEQKGNSSGV